MAPAEIPFEYRDGFIWVEVTIPESRGRLHFLLDSGAQVSVIDSAAAQRLGVKRGRPVTVESVGATSTGFWPQTLDARAGATELPRNYLMLDLSKLSQACTNTVDGILGADFFHDRIVQLDFEKRTIRLLQEAPTDTNAQVLPLRVRRCGMLVPVRVNNGASQWVRLDTGCTSALQWVTAKIRPKDCTRRVAVALTTISVPVTNTSLTLGSVNFKGVPTDLHEQEIFPGEKGLLGNGILSRFNTVTIDAKAGKLVLESGSPRID